MEKTVLFDDKTAREIYPDAAPKLKEMLEGAFSKGFFSQNIMDRIKTFEDACEYNNTNPKAKKFTQGTRNQIYQERVAEIVKALNEGWLADYDNDEYKYSPYFYLRKDKSNPSGFRFSGSGCSNALSVAACGSRFAFKTRDLSNYAGTQFAEEYKNWLTPEYSSASVKMESVHTAPKKPFAGTRKEWGAYITARVISFEIACSEIGEDSNNEKFSEGEPDDIAYQKLKVIVKALNGDWKPDWNNGSQGKWAPWFYLNTPGFRFFVSRCSLAVSDSASGSRLCFETEELANYAGRQFLELYKALLA